jgi:site-specific recombinase XerD
MYTDDQLIKNFATYLKKQNRSVNTVIAYTKDIEQLSKTNTQKVLTEFDVADIKNALIFLKQNKGLSAKTLSRKLNSFRTFFEFLVKTRKIKFNPALQIEHPKFVPQKQRILTPTEYLALREVSRQNDRLYTMIELLLQTGLRITELSNLQVGDVDISRREIRIRPYETNPKRKIPINNRLSSVLESYLRKHCKNKPKKHPLFSTRTGKQIIVRNIRNSIDRAIAKARLKNVCVNDIRNTFIVHQLSMGVPIHFLAKIVGHTNEATTQRYISLLEKKYESSGKNKIYEI